MKMLLKVCNVGRKAYNLGGIPVVFKPCYSFSIDRGRMNRKHFENIMPVEKKPSFEK